MLARANPRSVHILLWLAVAAVHACAPHGGDENLGERPAIPGAGAPAAITLAYRCTDGTAFDVRLEGELAWLTLADQTLVLRREASASGARYGDGRWTYWSKGDGARLEGPGIVHRDCLAAR